MNIPRNIRSRTEKIISAFIFITFSFFGSAFSQDGETMSEEKRVSELFKKQEVLSLKISYSNKEVKFRTNDSTYIKTDISYKDEDGSWKTLEVNLRARGNFRKKNCYYTPIKMKIKKAVSKGTLFEGNKKLKLVLPCYTCKNSNDYVIKEYMAYKLYESISPYHFKTRIVSIDFDNIKGRKVKSQKLFGILIEDIKKVAERHDGNVFKRHMNPLTQDPITSAQNAFFQFMIANTDFSTTFQHNQKQLFADKKILPVPYDFDMSGLVDADYAVVSKVQNRVLPIEEVTERLYKGFKRDTNTFRTVRNSFIANKKHLFQVIDKNKSFFKNPSAFYIARDFIADFYKILENDRKFQAEITEAARSTATKRARTFTTRGAGIN